MNILIIAHIYPTLDTNEDSRDSFFMHNYARQWSRMGHNVRVEHLALTYPHPFNLLCHKFKKLRDQKRSWGNYRSARYDADGVLIERRPMMKYIPHGMYFGSTLRRAASAIKKQLETDGFVPDIVLCDFLNPAVVIQNMLELPDPVKSFVIIHGTDVEYFRRYPQFAAEVNHITKLGYRSNALKKQCAPFLEEHDSFIIPSGIDKKYISEQTEPRTKISRILTVAAFDRNKFIDSIIKAVGSLNKKGGNYELTIVGDGSLRGELEELAVSFGGDGWCAFTGKISKDKVIEYMRETDLFVLVSRVETFGMVYVEAMSQGCVTIGSKDEGIDGTILDGQNGFLLPAGDSDALERKIGELAGWNADELRRISEAAAETGRRLTEERLAEDILKDMCG